MISIAKPAPARSRSASEPPAQSKPVTELAEPRFQQRHGHLPAPAAHIHDMPEGRLPREAEQRQMDRVALSASTRHSGG